MKTCRQKLWKETEKQTVTSWFKSCDGN